jgi:hypothetical protein
MSIFGRSLAFALFVFIPLALTTATLTWGQSRAGLNTASFSGNIQSYGSKSTDILGTSTFAGAFGKWQNDQNLVVGEADYTRVVSSSGSINDLSLGGHFLYHLPGKNQDVLPFVGGGLGLLLSNLAASSSAYSLEYMVDIGVRLLLNPNSYFVGTWRFSSPFATMSNGGTTTDFSSYHTEILLGFEILFGKKK